MSDRNQNGFAVLIVVVGVLILAAAVGGVFYFVGSKNVSKKVVDNNTVELTEPKETPKSTKKEISDSLESGIIEKELDTTTLDAIDKDLKDLDQEISSY